MKVACQIPQYSEIKISATRCCERKLLCFSLSLSSRAFGSSFLGLPVVVKDNFLNDAIEHRLLMRKELIVGVESHHAFCNFIDANPLC
ncbi:uncharacterized protein G2W53_028323 [Senna tora]|uniref:Uncharacterized protein n=1 Tax=Senna tora TaxID=362788 RepID=A0A834WEN2_9FABA|nr:uncharacterized protein G2W53_028323 [Senna tora]